MGKESGNSEAERDYGECVEVKEEKDCVWILVVDDGTVTCRYKQYDTTDDTTDC